MGADAAAVDEAIEAIARSPEGRHVAAFFDFDGTLIDGYSAIAYYEHRFRNFELGPREFAHLLLAGARGVSTTEEFTALAERSTRAWEGRAEEDLDELGERIFRRAVASAVYAEAWRLVKAHQQRGHSVAIASSATRFQVMPLARELEVEHVLVTPLETRDGLLTGRLGGDTLWGIGKANAVRRFAQEHGIDLERSYGYANGNEDVNFLEAVGRPRAVNPAKRLETVAQERNWPVYRFGGRGRPGPVRIARTAGAVAGIVGGLGAGLGLGVLNRNRRLAVDAGAVIAGELGLALAGIRVEVQGEEHLWSHRPAVFLFNHQSGIVDFLAFCKLVRRDFSGVAKKEVANAPVFGQFFRLADFAFVERAGSDPEQLRAAMQPSVEKLRSGISLVVSPEGTRSHTPRIGPFKKGVFHLAMQAEVPVIPVVVRNAGELMWRNAKTLRPGTLQVVVHRPVEVSGWTTEELTERVAEVRQLFLDTLADWPALPTAKALKR
jgi:HAD superfamily hydrolase (TIGR01490 family)